MGKLFFTSAIAISFLFSASLNAQVSFQKKIMIPGNSLMLIDANSVSDGGFLASGTDYAGNSMIMKTDAIGQPIWMKSFIPDSVGTYLNVITADECINGGYYFFATDYNYSYYLSKTDVSGNILWTKKFTFSDMPYSIPKIFQKPNGDFVIIPSLYGGTGIITIDQNGNYLWGQIFRDDPKCPGFSGVSCSDGGYMITGKDGSDVFIVKMNASGTVQWSSRYQDINLYSQARTILQTQDGNYLVAGYRMGALGSCGFAMKIDASGNTIWHKEYSDASFSYNYDFSHAIELQNGNIVFLDGNGAWGYSPSFITQIDPNGNLIYSKKIGATDPSTSYSSRSIGGIKLLPGGQLLLSGSTLDASGFYSGLLIKADANGDNFGCDVSDVSVTESTLPPIPRFTPAYTKTSIAPPINITLQTSNVSFSSEEVCLTGVSENPNPAFIINISPNPSADGNFTIETSDEGKKEFTVFNLMGEIIYSAETNQKSTISLGAPSGVYFLKLTDEKNNSSTKKMIISR